MADQQQIDAENRDFWDELCGTSLAGSLGITTLDAESLRRFDDAYLALYPYLLGYVDERRIRGSRVLEIGLGFGTLGQVLAQAGAEYHGVDIARNPVALMRERLRLAGCGEPANVIEASALALPYEDETFDHVYSIGCLHHTGDLPRAVSEVRRVLKPGGRAVVMLYNGRSFRRLKMAASSRLRRRTRDRAAEASDMRKRYDHSSTGDVAPHTDFVSRADVRRLFRDFGHVAIDIRNFDTTMINALNHNLMTLQRSWFLGNVDRVLGLDLYIRATR